MSALLGLSAEFGLAAARRHLEKLRERLRDVLVMCPIDEHSILLSG